MNLFAPIISAIAILALTACTTTQTLANLSPGMDKNQVRSIMGAPAKTAVIAGNEFWSYNLQPNTYKTINRMGGGREHVVVFKQGQVAEWGHWYQIQSRSHYTNRSDYSHGEPE